MARRRTTRSDSRGQTAFTPSSPWLNIEAFIADGGNVSLRRIAPIAYAAVASDEYAMLAALVRRNDESFMDLMQRLDTALAKAIENGEFTDEINARPPSRW